MRIIIAGSRNFNDYNLLEKHCHIIFNQLAKEGYISPLINESRFEIEIISGKAKEGADALGEEFAKKYKLKVIPFPANWNDLIEIPCKIKYNKYGKPYNVLAGLNRNEDMAIYASQDMGVLIAFWDGKSKGTKHMIDMAKKYNLKRFIINFTKEKGK